MPNQDTDGNRMIWDETLRQWVPVTGSLSPAELANEINPILSSRYGVGMQPRYRTGLGMWQYSSFLRNPSSTAWPTINRLYWCPFFFPTPVTISALGVNVSSAGTAGNVVRLGLWSPSAVDAPGAVIEEGTVAGDSTGNKTLTLSSARKVQGLIWVACGPQGSTSGGSSLLGEGVSIGLLRPTDSDVSSSWGGQYQNCQLYTTASSTVGDNPTVVLDSSFVRFPLVAVRIS